MSIPQTKLEKLLDLYARATTVKEIQNKARIAAEKIRAEYHDLTGNRTYPVSHIVDILLPKIIRQEEDKLANNESKR